MYERHKQRVYALLILSICPGLDLTCNRLVAQSEIELGRVERDETTRLISAELPQWKLWNGSNRQQELKLEPKSVLRWTNPGTGRVYGDLYIWTAGGRPEVVMSLFKAWEPANGFHTEMHSLSLVPIDAERKGQLMWHPIKPGVDLKSLVDVAAPEDSPARRLIQMRGLAKEFTAVLTDFRRTNTGERQELRLLTQPLFRYRSTDAALIDGAMFAFVLGTDPEMFLLIEARQSQGNSGWQYGVARMNNDSMIALHKEQEVFHFERTTGDDRLHSPYVLMSVPESARPN
jgi:hypothetical protein